jgi:hypothetical protein
MMNQTSRIYLKTPTVLKVFGSTKASLPDDERNIRLIKLGIFPVISLIGGFILLGCQLAGRLTDRENPWSFVMCFIAFGCFTSLLMFMSLGWDYHSKFFAIPVAFCAYLTLFLILLGFQLDGVLSFQSSWALVVLLPIVFVMIALWIFYCLSINKLEFPLSKANWWNPLSEDNL